MGRLCLYLMLCWCCLSVRGQATVGTFKEMLLKEARQGVMFGHHDDTFYGFKWKNEEGRSDTREVCGDYPAVMSFELSRVEKALERSIDGVDFDRMRREIRRHYERGGVIVLSWHADNPVTGGNAWDVSDSSVVHRILYDKEVKARYRLWIDRLSAFLKSLTDGNGNAIPLIFRPYHENHGSWFWWGKALCTAREYKALWKMTVKRLKRRGVRNVLYAYSPTAYFRDMDEYLERYPGNSIVDILGFDYYMAKRGTSVMQDKDIFVKQLERSFSILQPYADRHEKVLALTETGIRMDSVDGWWTQDLLPVLKKYPVSYLVVWRNATADPNECWGIYPGHYLEQDFIKFYQDPHTIFVNDIKE